MAFYVKQFSYLQGYSAINDWNPIKYLICFINSSLPFILLILIFALHKDITFYLILILPLAITFAYYFKIVQIMGFGARFYFPSLAYIIVLAYFAINKFEYRLKPQKSIFVSIIFIIIFVNIAYSPYIKNDLNKIWHKINPCKKQLLKNLINYKIKASRPLPALTRTEIFHSIVNLLKPFEKDACLETTEVGYIGASLPYLKIIDLTGLNCKKIALKGFHTIFSSYKADIILMPQSHYIKMKNIMLKSDKFWHDYYFYPYVFDYGIAIEKKSKHFNEIKQRLSQIFTKLYTTKFKLSDYLAKHINKSNLNLPFNRLRKK